jgi:hypothetical protein
MFKEINRALRLAEAWHAHERQHADRRIRSGCCARAASGHATAAPPRSVMNSRRFN